MSKQYLELAEDLPLNKLQCPCSFLLVLQVEHIVGGENSSKPCGEAWLFGLTDDMAFNTDHPTSNCDFVTSNWLKQQS